LYGFQPFVLPFRQRQAAFRKLRYRLYAVMKILPFRQKQVTPFIRKLRYRLYAVMKITPFRRQGKRSIIQPTACSPKCLKGKIFITAGQRPAAQAQRPPSA
jgi:hypothetical protein